MRSGTFVSLMTEAEEAEFDRLKAEKPIVERMKHAFVKSRMSVSIIVNEGEETIQVRNSVCKLISIYQYLWLRQQV